jgi:large subunit ribosomal protein L21
MKLAVIKTGGKQYLVKEGQILKIEKIEPARGKTIKFDQVLLRVDGEEVAIGQPYLKDAKIEAEILEQGKTKKVMVIKYKAKTRYKRKKGHRQFFTKVKIVKI